jgi:arylformamidase
MIRDISILLGRQTPEWPGDTPFDCRWTWRIADGASVNVSAIGGSPHVGTHADAPLHVRDGGQAAHELPLDAFVGAATVVDVRGLSGEIELEALGIAPARIAGGRLLLRTGCSIAHGGFPGDWPVLSEACLRALRVDAGLRLLGVDAPSVDSRESKTLTNHHLVFDGGAYVLENLDLDDVAAGDYELIAAPLRLDGADASPVRALLRDLRR